MDSQTINLGLYTFSALIQADSAIFGLFAVFLVYRLQALETNKQTSLNAGSSEHSPAKSEFTQLVLGIPLAQVHAILFRYSQSLFWGHLKTVAFTPKWKSESLKSSIPIISSIVLHVALCCIGLYYSNDPCPVIFLSPTTRISTILILFVFLLIFIAVNGYRSFSNLAINNIDPVPVIEILKLDYQNFVNLFPHQRGVEYIYRIMHTNENRYIKLSIDAQERYYVRPVKVTDKKDLTVTYEIGLLGHHELEGVFNVLKRTPDTYWPN